MFAIGDEEWPGVSKLVEETGELQQVLGKLMGSRGDVAHWSGDLLAMLHEEIGDTMAAIQFLVEKCGLDADAIQRRREAKIEVFRRWHEEDQEADS